MSELGEGSNSRQPTENDNEFLPAGPSSFQESALNHEQRRSLLLGNEEFFPVDSSRASKPPASQAQDSSRHEQSLGASSSKNQKMIHPAAELEDDENQFMLDQNSLAASINQGLGGNPSTLTNNFPNKDHHQPSEQQENSFPQLHPQPPENNQLASEVEDYQANFGLNMQSELDCQPPVKEGSENFESNVTKRQQAANEQEDRQGFWQESKGDIRLPNADQQQQQSGNRSSQECEPANASQSAGQANPSSHSLCNNSRQFHVGQLNSAEPQSNFPIEPQGYQEHAGLQSNVNNEQLGLPSIQAPSRQERQTSEVNNSLGVEQVHDVSGLINQESNKLNEFSHPGSQNQLQSDPLAGVSKLDSKIETSNKASKQPEQLNNSLHSNLDKRDSLNEARSSIINRIVVDQESIQKNQGFEVSLQGEPSKRSEADGNRGLLESQVVKYDRSNHELSRSNIESQHQIQSQQQTEKSLASQKDITVQDFNLDENDSRFLQPIEDSMRLMESQSRVKKVESERQEQNQEQSQQESAGAFVKREEISQNNLSNIILDPFPAQYSQNSNIRLDSSAGPKQQTVGNQSRHSHSSHRYQESLDEFKRNQIRKLQERSSIDHLQSNLSGAHSKPNTQNNGESEYFNEFDPCQSRNSRASESNTKRQKQGEEYPEGDMLNGSQMKGSEKNSQEYSRQQPSAESVSRKRSSIINQYDIDSKEDPSALKRGQEDSHSSELQAQPQYSQKQSSSQKQSLRGSVPINNESDLSRKSSKVNNSQLFQADKAKSSVKKSSLHSSLSPNDQQQSRNLNNQASFNNLSSKKQEVQTGNLLVQDQDSKYEPAGNSAQQPQEEVSKFPQQNQGRTDTFNLHTPQKGHIFNSFPEELQESYKYYSEQRDQNEEDPYNKIISTPNQHTKLERIPRDKLYSQKQSFGGFQHKKERAANRRESKDDQIERIRLLKEAQKKRLERQLEKVSKQLQQINHTQKKMERIYGEMQRMQSEDKNAKMSSHQNRHRKESEQFLKMIKQHRRLKEQEQLEFEDIDRNITNNLMELNRMRQETEDRKKQKKRLEIMERMKKNEIRKMNEIKQVKANNQYVHQFKAEPQTSPQVPKSPPRQPTNPSNLHQLNRPSRDSEPFMLNAGSKPIREPNQKSSKVKSIRSLGRKKPEDKYETRLD